MVGGAIQLAQGSSQFGTEPLDHALDAGDVVVGGADEGEEAFGGILSQHPHACRI